MKLEKKKIIIDHKFDLEINSCNEIFNSLWHIYFKDL